MWQRNYTTFFAVYEMKKKKLEHTHRLLFNQHSLLELPYLESEQLEQTFNLLKCADRNTNIKTYKSPICFFHATYIKFCYFPFWLELWSDTLPWLTIEGLEAVSPFYPSHQHFSHCLSVRQAAEGYCPSSHTLFITACECLVMLLSCCCCCWQWYWCCEQCLDDACC